jgi:hypothetical protein
MVNTEQGYRNEVSSDSQADSRTQWDLLRRVTAARKSIEVPAAGVWVCPEHFQPRYVSFAPGAQQTWATIRMKLLKDEDYSTLSLLGGIMHKLEPLEIDVDGGTATGIIVYA